MEDQYGISDLRQYIQGRSIFQSIIQPPELLSGGAGSLTPVLQQYQDQMNLAGPGRQQVTEMVPSGGGFHPDFRTDSTSGGCFSGLEVDAGGFAAAGDCVTGRWPRQETLSLLEIRSKLDSKFKEANHKGPLWDEVSRIMSEEHGYQRSGKKCREKFENLYKYYKKTKDGKAGRQDGKHYRFFRQLEALYGETSNNNIASSFSGNHPIASTFPYHHNVSLTNTTTPLTSKIADSLSLSNSSDFYSTSSDDVTVENDSNEKRRKRKGKMNWKTKIKDFIDSQMRKLMEKQDICMEKMMKNIEEKEKERAKREEDWKKQEAERLEREQKFWANERAWIEARDASLMDCLRKELLVSPPPQPTEQHTTMINGEGITKRDSINDYLIMNSAKKRKEDSRECCYAMNESGSISMENGNYSCSGNGQWDGTLRHGTSEQGGPRPDDGGGGGGAMPYGGYRYLLGDAGNLWGNNGVKFNKGENC